MAVLPPAVTLEEIEIHGIAAMIDETRFFNPRLTDRTYEQRDRDLLIKDSLAPFIAYNVVPPAKTRVKLPD